jgi:hypothetical protein
MILQIYTIIDTLISLWVWETKLLRSLSPTMQ